QCVSRRNLMPGRCAGRMRQWNHVETVASMHAAKFAANYVFQFCTVDKLRDRQSADRNNETRLQNPNLIIHPQSTVANLIRGWNAITAAGIFSWKTATDGSEIHFRSNGGLVHSTKLFENLFRCRLSLF